MSETLLDRLGKLNVWKRGAQRAPHKPLLLLLMFGRLQRGEARLVGFGEVEKPLAALLKAFGPPTRPSPENPYWYLQRDGVWVFEGPTDGLAGPTNTPRVMALRDGPAVAGLPRADFEQLEADPGLLSTAARLLLEEHFPETLHEDILQAVGLSLDVSGNASKRRRDPRFRPAVLAAYDYRCAVCDWQLVADGVVEGLDAAHVKWHAADGPDEVSNGLALCSLHHKALDRGWYGVDDSGRLRISHAVSGNDAFASMLGRFDDKPLRTARRAADRLKPAHRRWHWSEVFRGAA